MVDNLIYEFRKMVNEADWVDSESKQKIQEKVISRIERYCICYLGI